MKLLAVTNDQLAVDTLVKHMIEMAPYVDRFIIRERSKTIREQIYILERAVTAGVNREMLIINDRVDLALVMNLSKVQLPGHGLNVQRVKQQFPGLQVGRSIHSLQEAQEASRLQADWLLYGHLFPTSCKPGVPARGLQNLQIITQQVPIEVYAIGGILPKHIDTLAKAGVAGVAVMSSIFSAPCPTEKAREYYDACQRLTN